MFFVGGIITMVKQSSDKLTAVPFTEVRIQDNFWSPRLETHKNVTLSTCLDQCESTGRIANFTKAAGLMEGKFEGIYFNDSDVYKVIEGAGYTLMNQPDPELEKRVDGIIDQIAAAQEKDGYLCCYFTLVAPDCKWTDMEKHEMYCAGHLMEAAVAYKRATGKRKLLDVACKLADHIDRIFRPGKRHWVEGHEEIELALVKLYQETKEDRYLKLAYWLLEERGHGHGVGMIWDREEWGPAYCQDDKPVREITEVRGHAVRAMYLYTAMADVAAATNEDIYVNALDRLWEHAVTRNMYITGGIGPSKENEGFTEDYDLPNDSAYCETCASVGMVLWNHRMNLLHRDGKYADVVERAMYNGALAGISFAGDHFFYVNPLASNGEHHRVKWFETSCCPTTISRFIPSLGGYVYATSDDSLWVNLYIQSKASIQVGDHQIQIVQTTNYPVDSKVEIGFEQANVGPLQLNLRFPGWCRSAQVFINGEQVQGDQFVVEKGYIRLERDWAVGDKVTIDFEMHVQTVHSHPKVKANEGRVAFQRGPLVYCVEKADNPHLELDQFSLPATLQLTTTYVQDLLGGIVVVLGITSDGQRFVSIPYYAWDNREPGFMQVWMKEELTDSLYS
jgi:DUF1680 family protein